jgi:hypothetical protein
MPENDTTQLVLFAVALAMGVATVVFSFTDLRSFDTEPLLGIAVFCLAVAGLRKIEEK